MARVKRGVAAHKKHKKLLKEAEGRRASKHKLVRPAREAALHALNYAYRDRRKKKGQFRALWIARINAASRESGVSYSRLMGPRARERAEVDGDDGEQYRVDVAQGMRAATESPQRHGRREFAPEPMRR